jgi:hypothetical protein
MSLTPQALNVSYSMVDNGDNTVTFTITVKNNANTQTLNTFVETHSKNISPLRVLRRMLFLAAVTEDAQVAWGDVPVSASFNIPLMTIADLVG